MSSTNKTNGAHDHDESTTLYTTPCHLCGRLTILDAHTPRTAAGRPLCTPCAAERERPILARLYDAAKRLLP